MGYRLNRLSKISYRGRCSLHAPRYDLDHIPDCVAPTCLDRQVNFSSISPPIISFVSPRGEKPDTKENTAQYWSIRALWNLVKGSVNRSGRWYFYYCKSSAMIQERNDFISMEILLRLLKCYPIIEAFRAKFSEFEPAKSYSVDQPYTASFTSSTLISPLISTFLFLLIKK